MITRRGLLKGMLGGVGLMVLAPVTSEIPSKPGPVLHIIDEVPSAHEIYGRGPAEAVRITATELGAMQREVAVRLWNRSIVCDGWLAREVR